ncbi:hypothetical protein ECA02_33070 [Enterococcus casseliflavus]|nr:hypothetical protein ECA02_33070 [Enterococcus casseliflavus]
MFPLQTLLMKIVNAMGRLLYLAASNSSASFFGENRLNADSLIWATSNVRMNIDSGASVVANNNGTARAIHLASGGRSDLGEGSLLLNGELGSIFLEGLLGENFQSSIKSDTKMYRLVFIVGTFL